MPNVIDMKDMVIGNWTVLKFVDITKTQGARWLCECKCRTRRIISGSDLRRGSTHSCGCSKVTSAKENPRLYRIYNHMKDRCYRSNNKDYKYYGGRGIKICDEWLKGFQYFYEWAIKNGYSDNLTIDRKDVSGNYEPLNCRWITQKQQSNNTRRNHVLSHNGQSHTLSEWQDITGIKQNTILNRLRNGFTIEDALKVGD